MATKGGGTSLVYKNKKKLLGDLRHRIADLYNTDTAGTNPARLSQFTPEFLCVCLKKSATSPGNYAGDYPMHLGDFCIHYNASGVYQGVYVCTSVAITGSVVAGCTWTQLTVS